VNTTEQAPLDLAWQPELADYVEAYRARNRARRVWRTIAVCVGVLAAILAVGLVMGDGTIVGLGLGGLIAVALLKFVFQPRAVRIVWRRNPALRSGAEARVDPQTGVTSSNGNSTGQIQWSGIHSFLETEHLFLIQLGDYRRKPFIVLAKRGLADPSRVADLRAILTTGIASSTAPASEVDGRQAGPPPIRH
jgi:hypothetical protein